MSKIPKSICWDCSLPGHGLCSWDAEFIPVHNAAVLEHVTRAGEIRYIVLDCPQFTKKPMPYKPRNVSELCNAIIKGACEDYRNAWHKRLGKEPVQNLNTIVSVERFFASTWFKELSNLDPTALLDALQWDIFCEEILAEAEAPTSTK